QILSDVAEFGGIANSLEAKADRFGHKVKTLFQNLVGSFVIDGCHNELDLK
ncbi:8247_t:CDS:1, partial [Entrophospora sp. SA101]